MEHVNTQEKQYHPRKVREVKTNKSDVLLVKKISDLQIHLIDGFKERTLDIIGYNTEKTVLRAGEGQVVTHEIAVPLRNVREQIMATLDTQPKIVQNFLKTTSFFDYFERETWIDGQHILFSERFRGNSGRHYIFTLFEITPGYYIPRTFYVSLSDYTWRAYIAKDDQNPSRIVKGREDAPNFHYVQDSKVHKKLEIILKSIPVSENKKPPTHVCYESELDKDELWSIGEKNIGKTYYDEQDVYEFKDPEWREAQARLELLYIMYKKINHKKVEYNSDTMILQEHQYNFTWPKETEGELFTLNELRNTNDVYISLIVYRIQSIIESQFSKKGLSISNELKNAYVELKDILQNFSGTSFFLSNNEQDDIYSEKYVHWANTLFREYILAFPMPDTMLPNFSKENCLSVIKDRESGMIHERYVAKNAYGEEMYWDIATNQDRSAVWVDQCSLANSKMNSFGTERDMAYMGLLIYKPYDYSSQIQGLLSAKEIKKRYLDYRERYIPIHSFWENFQIIKKYRQERLSYKLGETTYDFTNEDQTWDKDVAEEERAEREFRALPKWKQNVIYAKKKMSRVMKELKKMWDEA